MSVSVDSRLLALKSLAILDTEPEQVYQDAVLLAAQICGTSMAAISLVDQDRQWFKAELGLGMRETPLDWSFCRYTIADSSSLEIADAAQDERFRDNPLVTGAPNIRFYAGAPLVLADGHAVGALCVLDSNAGRLTDAQRSALNVLAQQVAVMLQTHRAARELQQLIIERDAAADQAELAAEQLRSVFDGVSAGSVLTGPDGVIVLANRALDKLLDSPPHSWVGRNYLDLIAPQEQGQEKSVLASMWRDRTPSIDRETSVRAASGDVVVLASSALVCDVDGQPVSVQTRLESIADRRQAEVQLQEAQSALDGIITVDAQERIVSWNAGASRVLGHPKLAALGKNLSMIVPKDSRAGHARGFARLAAGAPPVLLGRTVELEALHANGLHVPIELSLSRWFRDGQPYFTAVIRDITERRRTEAEQQWRAEHDPVSGLGNLDALRQWWTSRLPAAAARQDYVGVLSMRLLGLTDISTALGVVAVETLLATLGLALRRAGIEGLELFHLGDSNFAGAVVLTGSDDLAGRLTRVAEYVLAAASGPFDVDGLPVHLDAKIGVVGTQMADTTVDELLRQAEVVRNGSARRISIDTETNTNQVNEHDLRLRADLYFAVAAGQLEMYFQPLTPTARSVDPANPAAANQAPHVVEALMRWHHPIHGLVSPGVFIPLAESSPLITELTRWALTAALTAQRAWEQQGLDVEVAVNLSPEVLVNDDVTAMVAAALRNTGCAAQRLKIEITESAIVAEPDKARQVVTELRTMGVSVSLDDFGTGYTSLNLLRTLPIDEIKLDRTFVTTVTTNPADTAIAAAVVDLAHRMDIHAVAEGIEDNDTAQLLTDMGYDLLQGFLFAKPMPAADLTTWLRTIQQKFDLHDRPGTLN